MTKGAALLFAVLLSIPAWGGGGRKTPVGYWRTVPDDDSAPATIQIWLEQGRLAGKIVALHGKPGEDPNPKCDRCEGALKDKPILNMTILQGLKEDGDEWSGGTVLDPGNGKSYSCKIQLVDGGAKLKVRGYVGVSLFGRSQFWVAASAP